MQGETRAAAPAGLKGLNWMVRRLPREGLRLSLWAVSRKLDPMVSGHSLSGNNSE